MTGQVSRQASVLEGDCRDLMGQIAPGSVDLSIWSPPYFVGKRYEAHLAYEEWIELLRDVVALHREVLKPGGFTAINIADILCFADDSLPRIQANGTKRSSVTREMILSEQERHPDYNRHQLAAALGCSEQTIQRRLEHNNVRGGKHTSQTRIKTVAGLIEDFAVESGLVMYDRRVWVKDPAWANSRWHSNSYRSVDEFEYVFILWNPGITTVDRGRLTSAEWAEWGSRGVWKFPSVRVNDDHEAKFPIELPSRLIQLLSDPGELVLDPFSGSGTTGVAAIRQDRRYLGFELDSNYVRQSRRLLETS